MKIKTDYGNLEGNLQIWMIDENNTKKIMIYGDPKGLKSLGKILIGMSEVDYSKCPGMPIGEREHTHLLCSSILSKGSLETIIGRLDAKGTGNFPKSFICKKNT